MNERKFFKKENWKIVWFFPKLKDWIWEVKEVKMTRSIKQNALYWVYFLKQLVLFHNELWEVKTVESLHEELKKTFLKVRVKSDFSKKWIWKVWTTTKLNTKQFKKYMEKINNYYMENFWFSVDLDISQNDLLYWESLFV